MAEVKDQEGQDTGVQDESTTAQTPGEGRKFDPDALSDTERVLLEKQREKGREARDNRLEAEYFQKRLEESEAGKKQLQKQMQEMEARINAFEDAQKKAELEKMDKEERLAAQLKDAEEKAAKANAFAINTKIENYAIAEATRLRFKDPQVVLGFLKRDQVSVTGDAVDESDVISQVKTLAEQYEYLLQPEPGRQSAQADRRPLSSANEDVPRATIDLRAGKEVLDDKFRAARELMKHENTAWAGVKKHLELRHDNNVEMPDLFRNKPSPGMKTGG